MAAAARAAPTVLLVGLSSDVVSEVLAPLMAAGFQVEIGAPADLGRRRWDLVVCAPAIPGLGGMELVSMLQAVRPTPPLLVIGGTPQMMRAPGVDCLPFPFAPSELVGRALDAVRGVDAPDAGLPPLPPAAPVMLLAEAQFLEALAHEREELREGRSPGDSFVACVRLDELRLYGDRWTATAQDAVFQQLARLTGMHALAQESLGRAAGELLILMPGTSEREVAPRLQDLSELVASHQFSVSGQAVQFSPVIGYAGLLRSAGATEALARARDAAGESARHLDLHPAAWKANRARPGEAGPLKAWWTRHYGAHMLLYQYALTSLLGLGLPFLVYWWLGTHGMDISTGVYIFVVLALGLTAVSIWAEGFLALRREDPPDEPAQPYPAASAIIAAYLPNEAPIIEESVRAFLRVQYPAPLQVILAYNTPRDMPEVEERLRQMALENPRFVPMRVETSTSKAQNVNAALPYATGAFTAVFDADHQPDPDSFRRAWRWISHGADVVQGHCFIRNGTASWVSRMVAIEFEQIYAVSHPGRARLHGFGIFGGSNGYWRTELLRELRMHGFMLTEDIDSSMRAVVRGRRIVSDPHLVSRELAPETLQALTKQRLRWAQGWLQISLKWIVPALRSKQLSWRQKLGMMQLLVWREAYPWVSMQILPLIAWWAVRAGSLRAIDWLVPLFVVTTLFTLGTGPGQIFFTYRLADPQIRRHASWFWFYVATSTLFYAGLKNAWNRIAHYKEWRGETTRVVTPRVKAKK